MTLRIKYDDLIPVANSVRAGIVSYNGNDLKHENLLRNAIPRFLGTLGTVHGEAFPLENLEAVIRVANAKDIEVDFLLAAYDSCSPAKIIGLATGARTFGAEWDEKHNLRIVPIHHGEDLVVNREEAKIFRKLTKTEHCPDGVGAGSWFMRSQILRSLSNPDWRYAGRDNEHRFDNYSIIGVMNKYGSIPGTEQDSAVLQLNKLPPEMKRRWGINDIIKEDLPADALGLTKDPNSFLTRWSSQDGTQHIVVIFTKLASTFDGQPVVWTKIQSHGQPLPMEMRKEILASLLRVGYREIESPERLWGIPRGNTINELNRALGSSAPVLHLHLNNERDVLEALLEMDAQYRFFGHGKMVSGNMRLSNMRNPEVNIGQNLPIIRPVKRVNSPPESNKPHFDLALS